MKIDLSEVVLNVRKQIAYDFEEPPIQEENGGLTCTRPVKGRLKFSNTSGHILIRGNIDTEIELECNRCAKAYARKIEMKVEEEIPLKGDHVDTDEWEMDGDLPEEQKEPIFEDNVLNLTELLRQNILVAVPIKQLCSDGCKGICPICGKDLAEGDCGCEEQPVNSPFAKLQSLLDEEESDE